MPSPSRINADDEITGLVFIGNGNVYANVDGVLLSTPELIDGRFSRDEGDWSEVANCDDKPDEIAAACAALGLPVPQSKRP